MNRNQPNSDREDMRLVAFLKHNKPIAPEPAIDLEQRIMGEIHRQVVPPISFKPTQKLWRRGMLAASGAIAATILAMWSANRQIQPTISEADRTQIEASLIENWSTSIDGNVDEPNNPDLAIDIHETK
jgi:hypothetical protein